jgi:hypothetical protein
MPYNIGTTYDTSIPPDILANLAPGVRQIRERLMSEYSVGVHVLN